MPVLCLLDANVLIDANRDYYPIARVPEFWDWLLEMGRLGRIKIPQEFYEEVIFPRPTRDRPDPLVEWLKTNKDALVLDEEAGVELVTRVTEQGYASDLTEHFGRHADAQNLGCVPCAHGLGPPNSRSYPGGSGQEAGLFKQFQIVCGREAGPYWGRSEGAVPPVSQDGGIVPPSAALVSRGYGNSGADCYCRRIVWPKQGISKGICSAASCSIDSSFAVGTRR